MKKKMPRHDEQFDAMMQVIYLMDAAYAIYRATYDEDPVTPEEVSIALGWHPGEQKWVSNLDSPFRLRFPSRQRSRFQRTAPGTCT